MMETDITGATLKGTNLKDADMEDVDDEDAKWDGVTCPDGTAGKTGCKDHMEKKGE